jgi:radical SAM protein with 4Fe4S-binding SPASM domain
VPDVTAKSYVKKIKSSQALLWNKRSPLLKRMDIELTERCNNNCLHCCINLPADDQLAKDRELSTDQLKKILEQASQLGCLSVRFTGGEPLLREDFEELYLFTRRLGIRVSLFTNATLITPHLAKLFAQFPPLDEIEITVYGMEKASYEGGSRTPDSFETAWKGIDLLLKNQVPFVVKSAYLPLNKKEFDIFREWAATIPWMTGPPPYSLFFDLRCRRDSEEKNRIIKGLRVSPPEGLRILTRIQPEFAENMKAFCSKFMYPPGDKLFSCSAGAQSGCLDAYGYFFPCLLLKHPDTGYDLKKDSLKGALTNFFPEVRKIRATNPDYLSRCARCFLKGLCEQCPAKSWTEHGILDTPVEYLCQIAHTMARYFKLLDEGEKAWDVKNWRERIKRFSGTDIRSEDKMPDETRSCNA